MERQRELSKFRMRRYRERKKLEGNSSLKSFLDSLNDCPDCQHNPVVFITAQKIPLCAEHWKILSDTDIEWSETDE